MNKKKEAERDAFELARATMFFGEGAGNRRKLIAATVQHKLDTDPNGYGVHFYRAIDNEDMAKHAEAARKERKKIDRSKSASRNVRALATGNYGNATSNVVVLMTVAYVAHKTGLDKKAYEKGKVLLRRAQSRIKQYRHNIRPVN